MPKLGSRIHLVLDFVQGYSKATMLLKKFQTRDIVLIWLIK